MAVDIRTISPDEVVAYRTAVRVGFGNQETVEDPQWCADTVQPVDRVRAAFEHDRIVATLHSFPTELTLPGGATVPAGAVTAVTCQPTHRRQGLLTRMIGEDLAASRERGEQADVLIAAEYPIYGRFGYGPAVMAGGWELDLGAARFANPGAGTVEFADNVTFRKEAPAVFERVRRERPGMIVRSELDWDIRADLRRRPEEKPWTGFRVLCRDDNGTVQGWANYKLDERWTDMRPHGKVEVADLCAATAAAEARLWRFLAELDLVATLTAGDRPVDDTLPWLLADARAAKPTVRFDFLWVRPLDVPALLAARSYDTAGRLVLEVTDALGLAGGRFALDATVEGATCTTTGEAAEVTVPVRTLGAAVLGGQRIATLHRAGWLDEHAAGAVERADRLLASTVTPWCNTWF